MKKGIEKALQQGNALFYAAFLLFAAWGMYFSIPYGLIGIAVCVILRVVALRSESERKQRVRGLMENIQIEGGEVRLAVTKSPLPTVVALATTGEIVWANDSFAEISGQFAGARHMRMTELAPTFETRWLIEGKSEFRVSCAWGAMLTMCSAA